MSKYISKEEYQDALEKMQVVIDKLGQDDINAEGMLDYIINKNHFNTLQVGQVERGDKVGKQLRDTLKY